MALDINGVIHDDGRTGRVVGEGPHCYHRVVNNETGKEEQWHIQEMRWPALTVEPADAPISRNIATTLRM